jgi:ADP-dependent NAD(P)H-hydrate dehydratase / NAD(P)H-hydrate epimerase
MRLEMSPGRALLSVGQMGEADRYAINSGVPAVTLMENAGRAVAQEIVRRWDKRPTLVLCGPGNNGGDGFVVARLLREAGWPVRLALPVQLALHGPLEKLLGEARFHANLWQGSVEPLTPEVIQNAELVVDAIFGAGLNRPLDGDIRDTLAEVAARKIDMLAIDVPTGIMGDSGASLGAIPAAVTVTFFRKKPGHLLLPGRDYCGDVIVADIGIPETVFSKVIPNTFENSPALWLDKLPLPIASHHKYKRGHALISGGYPMTGAARLSAIAAARAGAGLTTTAVPEVAFPIYAAALTSIMVHPLSDNDAFDKLIQEKRFSAFLIGPGAGVVEETRCRTLAMLKTGKATVIDADALTAFQANPGELFQAIQGPCVMTPHEGEFQRLFESTSDKLSRSRMAATQSNAVIILKGADTVISEPGGCSVINTNAPATLATAGAGDVLSGILLGLLAQGMEPFFAALAAVWIHGEAANRFGLGLIAEDLPNQLPAIYQELARAKAGQVKAF